MAGSPSGDIAVGTGAEMHPVPTASPRNDDRIATILLENFEHTLPFVNHSTLHRHSAGLPTE